MTFIVYLLTTCYTLSKKKKKSLFCQSLVYLKVLDGYYSNYRNLISMDDMKLVRLKSHDCHVLMQQLLHLAVCLVLPESMRYTIANFCFSSMPLVKSSSTLLSWMAYKMILPTTLCCRKSFPL